MNTIKFLTLGVIVFLLTTFANAEQATIRSIGDLTDKGNGLYEINMTKSSKHGVIQVSNAQLDRNWFLGFDFKLGSDWDWGSTPYLGGDNCRSNIKVFRFWNPGDTRENVFIEFSGYDDNKRGQAKLVIEDKNGDAQEAHYFLGDLKAKIGKEKWNRIEVEFIDSSASGKSDGSIRVWFNGELVLSQDNKLFSKTGLLRRPFLVGFSDVWCEGDPDGAPNTLQIKNVYLGKGETKDNAAPPPPDPEPDPEPVVYGEWLVIKGDLGLMNFPSFCLVGDRKGNPNALQSYNRSLCDEIMKVISK